MTVASLTDPGQVDVLHRALVVSVVASAACALLSCWLVLIGWSLMGDAVSHSVLPGVVLAYASGVPFAVGAFVFGVGTVALIGGVRATTRVKEDAAIGVVFTTLFAIGLVLVAVTPSDVDLEGILFGNVLEVSDGEVIQVIALGVLASAVLILKNRDLTLYAFDPVHAHVVGVSPRRMQVLLLGTLALTAVVALQAVGVVLVVAMLITPGATATLLTDRLSRMLLIAPLLAVGCAVIGVSLAIHADLPAGAMIVVTQGAAFVVAYLVRAVRLRWQL